MSTCPISTGPVTYVYNMNLCCTMGAVILLPIQIFKHLVLEFLLTIIRCMYVDTRSLDSVEWNGGLEWWNGME